MAEFENYRVSLPVSLCNVLYFKLHTARWKSIFYMKLIPCINKAYDDDDDDVLVKTQYSHYTTMQSSEYRQSEVKQHITEQDCWRPATCNCVTKYVFVLPYALSVINRVT